MNYKTRMLEELLGLKTKIVRLESYLENKIKDNQESLEEKQLKIMKEYEKILKERLMNCLKNEDLTSGVTICASLNEDKLIELIDNNIKDLVYFDKK